MLKTVLLLKEGEDNLGVSFILGFPDAQRVVLAGDGERRMAAGRPHHVPAGCGARGLSGPPKPADIYNWASLHSV